MTTWAVSMDAAGPDGDLAPALDLIEDLVDELGPYHASTNESSVDPRYGAAFDVEATHVVRAVELGLEVFREAAEKVGLPAWPVVRLEAMTVAEQDRLQGE